MINTRLKWLLRINVQILLICLISNSIAYAEDVSYTIVDEVISDLPTKTQIVQNIVISGTPSKAELEAEIMKRYQAALDRRGFEYHNPATNIFIYYYATEDQAKKSQSKWIGMIAKGSSDKGDPKVVINEDRFNELSNLPELKKGLSEKERKLAFHDIAASQDRATKQARAQVPDSEVMRQIELEQELAEKYKTQIVKKYKLSDDQYYDIISEGVKKGW